MKLPSGRYQWRSSSDICGCEIQYQSCENHRGKILNEMRLMSSSRSAGSSSARSRGPRTKGVIVGSRGWQSWSVRDNAAVKALIWISKRSKWKWFRDITRSPLMGNRSVSHGHSSDQAIFPLFRNAIDSLCRDREASQMPRSTEFVRYLTVGQPEASMERRHGSKHWMCLAWTKSFTCESVKLGQLAKER